MKEIKLLWIACIIALLIGCVRAEKSSMMTQDSVRSTNTSTFTESTIKTNKEEMLKSKKEVEIKNSSQYTNSITNHKENQNNTNSSLEPTTNSNQTVKEHNVNSRTGSYNEKTNDKISPNTSKVDKVKDITPFVKNNIKLGMSKSEVISILGKPDEIAFDSLVSEISWKYIVRNKEKEYEPNTEYFDSVDMDGLLNKSINIQLFISWDKEIIDSYVFYYSERDQEVLEYRVFKNGIVRESTL
ncbi:hypothetical protein [Aquibacillus kalidii]|uniref:hypothetical protein n=1 Tax=Aquibacillus kalidii TaxID=2762597 RepID=UPI001646E37C|nr:hypothetical protein [Aquibacillus kalidii]